jgi:putative transcriptional regulator
MTEKLPFDEVKTQTSPLGAYPDLTGHFLIAMPQLQDPNFAHALTFICEHNASGALGIMVNKPLNITLHDVFGHLNLEASSNEDHSLFHDWVFSGGPVQTDRGFVLHTPQSHWESTISIGDHISLSTSMDILKAIGQGKGPRDFLVALGYAGWGAGQLEKEVCQNAWLTVPAEAEIIFKTPVEQRWCAAAIPLGIDLNLMSSTAGHA